MPADEIPCGSSAPIFQWRRETRRFFLWASDADVREVNDLFTMMEHEVLTVLQYRGTIALCTPYNQCAKHVGKSEVPDPREPNYHKRWTRPWKYLKLVRVCKLKVRYRKEITCE